MSNFSVSFGHSRVLPGVEFYISDVQKPPRVSWQALTDQYFSVIMWDLDAPYPQNNTQSPFMHWWLLNTKVRNGNIVASEEYYSYLAPSPPSDSPRHRYVVALFFQPSGSISLQSLPKPDRPKFPLNEAIEGLNLHFVDETWFRASTKSRRPKQLYGIADAPPNLLKTLTPYVERVTTADEMPSLPGAPEDQMKICRLLGHVTSRQPIECLLEGVNYTTRPTLQGTEGKCYQPYRVTVSQSPYHRYPAGICGKWFDFENFSDTALISWGLTHNQINVPIPFSREQMLANVQQYICAGDSQHPLCNLKLPSPQPPRPRHVQLPLEQLKAK